LISLSFQQYKTSQLLLASSKLAEQQNKLIQLELLKKQQKAEKGFVKT
jgi:hypothetical protein